MISDFTSLISPAVLENNTAVYIRPPIPRAVSNAPKILFKFIIFNFNNLFYFFFWYCVAYFKFLLKFFNNSPFLYGKSKESIVTIAIEKF